MDEPVVGLSGRAVVLVIALVVGLILVALTMLGVWVSITDDEPDPVKTGDVAHSVSYFTKEN